MLKTLFEQDIYSSSIIIILSLSMSLEWQLSIVCVYLFNFPSIPYIVPISYKFPWLYMFDICFQQHKCIHYLCMCAYVTATMIITLNTSMP